MDLVSELKRVTERLAILEEKLAHLELAQSVPSVTAPVPAHGLTLEREGTQPLKYSAKPMVYERKASAAPRTRK